MSTLTDELLTGQNISGQNEDIHGEYQLEEHLTEAALERLAVAFNLLESEISADNVEALREQQTIVRLNRDAKISALTTRSALVMARGKNDPLFAKYARFSALKRQFRDMIVKKYGNMAAQRARTLVQNAGRNIK